MAAAKRVIRYLIGTKDLGLLYKYESWDAPGFSAPVKPTEVIGYSDADWAGDRDTRKSSTCYLTFLSGTPSWRDASMGMIFPLGISFPWKRIFPMGLFFPL
jgi:hypothetical protein